MADINGEGTSHSLVTTTAYDPLGRVRKVTAPLTGTSETVYTPADSGGPVTSIKTINAMGHSSITAYDPGRALPLTVTDTNGRVTRTEYDALGRLVRGWSPSRSSGGKDPDVQVTYQTAVATATETKPAAVTVKSLKDDGGYSGQVTIYDGLAREVQTQTEAHGAGRIITDTKYDDHGLVWEKTGGYLAKGEPTTKPFARTSETLVPSRIKTRYDGLERVVRESEYHGADYKYASYTYYGDNYVFNDPAGATAPSTETHTDAMGRVSSIDHYTTSAGPDAARTTSYQYDARGNRTKVTDPAGNLWTYTYDVRGRLTKSTDPDTGTALLDYDDADRQIRSEDALGKSVHTKYDELDRVTAIREGSATASPVKEFTYDTLPGAVGLPVASIRHDSGGDYINRVTGYDTDYRPTGRETVIPANGMTAGLSGTYAYSYAYTPTGKPLSVTLPAMGGLAAEKVVTRYDSDGLAESTSGLDWYTSDVTFSPYGEALRSVSGPQPSRVWTTNFVDQYTGTLQRTVADGESVSGHRISDSYYSYDASGTITSNARKLTDATGSTWDNQCYTYDALGELVHAWTSNITPGGSGTGCRSSGGTNWGYREDGMASGGPVADAPDTAADTTSPDAGLTASLAAAAPATGTVSTGTTAYRQSFTFDWLGSRATLTEHDTADATKNVTYRYGYGRAEPPGAQPHTLSWISSTPTGKGSSYTNDAVGNTKVRDLAATTQQLEWTAENKLATITDDGVKTTYVYDADGNRVLENSATGSTLYLGETELTTDSTGKIIRSSRAYAHPGAPTVVRTTVNGATTGHKLNVLIADHLGTANTTVELGGTQPVTRRAFKPYGEARGPKPSTWPNKRSYLGVGIDDAATGLTHIGAREYDQAAGRFLSADPLIDIADPLQMNGYAYSNNSPVSSSDPTGLMAMANRSGGPSTNTPAPPPPPASSGSSTTVTYTTTKTVTVTKPAPCDWLCRVKGFAREHVTVITVVTEVVVGVGCGIGAAAAGAATAGVGTVVVGTACGAAAGFAAGVVGNAIDPKADHSLGGYMSAAGKGAGVGAVSGVVGAGVGKLAGMAAGKIAQTAVGQAIGKGLKAAGSKLMGKGGASARAGAGTAQCFLAGTPVLLADGTSKNIEDIEVGDKVLATNPATGETSAQPVTELLPSEGEKKLNELTITTASGNKKITATAEHPFWVPQENAWVNAADLKPGTTLSTPDGTTAKIAANRAYTDHVRTYNFSVAKLHTYYVLAGVTPVLVHNTCPNPGPAQQGSTFEDYANANRGANKASTPDFVTEYTAPSGNRYWGRTQGDTEIEPGSALDEVLGANGRDTCSEICAMNEAQKAEGDSAIFGGSFRTLRVRPLGSPMESGVPFDPCEESCQTVIRKTFGTW